MLIELIVALIVIGLLLWVVQMLPIDPAIMQIIRVVMVIFVVLWLLSVLLGYSSPFPAHHRLL